MLELLSTYDEQSAALAKDDAEKCMLDFIANPSVFIMDHVLTLKPVAAMKGELLHNVCYSLYPQFSCRCAYTNMINEWE